MIVLDEQLLGRNLDAQISKWYRGTVCFITDLRPNTVIKDDAIPLLLQRENQPTFITINEQDFWRQVAINRRFCIVCCALSDSQAHEIPARLRTLLKHPLFNTKQKRMGKVIRLTSQHIRAVSSLVYGLARRRHARTFLSGIQLDRRSGFPPKACGNDKPVKQHGICSS